MDFREYAQKRDEAIGKYAGQALGVAAGSLFGIPGGMAGGMAGRWLGDKFDKWMTPKMQRQSTGRLSGFKNWMKVAYNKADKWLDKHPVVANVGSAVAGGLGGYALGNWLHPHAAAAAAGHDPSQATGVSPDASGAADPSQAGPPYPSGQMWHSTLGDGQMAIQPDGTKVFHAANGKIWKIGKFLGGHNIYQQWVDGAWGRPTIIPK